MKTVQATLVKKGNEDTVNQPKVDLVLAHVESFRTVIVAKTVYAHTISGNVYMIEGEENLAIVKSVLE